MPHRTFIAFVLPSILAMLVFIALPIVSAVVQSLFIEHRKVLVIVDNCDPFGCKKEQHIDNAATEKLQRERPLGQFNGINTYLNSNHLAADEIAAAWTAEKTLGGFAKTVAALPFYHALFFTLFYTVVVTPLVVLLGFAIALAVNSLPGIVRGPVIFVSLLPMIITPLIGSLVLFWMIDANGIIGGTLQKLVGDSELSLKASATLTWVVIVIYGVWNAAPFAFIILYTGLQTVPGDTLESAMIDGASRWERIRFVVLPHLMPLFTFITLIQLMDNFRVFEPIVGFSAEAHATSLSWIIYNDLRGQGTPLFGSAAATSVLTIIGVMLLMSSVLRRTWRDFKAKG
jgi:ABC-type sugar transport system permease subunit